MSVQAARLVEEEPPPTTRRARRIAGKAGQYLLYVLCAAPVALFPLGLVYKLIFS